MNPQTKLRLMRLYESNPALAFVQGLEAIQTEMISKVDREIKSFGEKLPIMAMPSFVDRMKGDKGEKGDQGAEGMPGQNGKDSQIPGPRGEKGPLGASGPQGAPGKDGKIGPKGPRGDQGLQGKDGRDGKDGSPDKPQDIVRKINILEDAIAPKAIKGLSEFMKKAPHPARRDGGSKAGGGMGNWVHKVFSVSSVSTTLTLQYRVAASGSAMLLRYQGQVRAHGVQYSISDKVITLLFTPQDNTFIEVTYVRA